MKKAQIVAEAIPNSGMQFKLVYVDETLELPISPGDVVTSSDLDDFSNDGIIVREIWGEVKKK